MAQYYVLGGSNKANQYQVAVHIDVPAGNNDATPAKTWAEVAVESQESTASAVPWLAPAAQTDLDNGTTYELLVSIEVDAYATGAQKLAAFEAELANVVAVETSNLQERLRYWGQEGTV